MRSSTPRITVCGVMLVAILASPAGVAGIVAVKRDFPDLVARAEQIVVGTVTAITEIEDESGTPFTFVTLSDLAVLKGDAGAELTLRFYGGGSGRYAVRVSDMPVFSLGERGLLFVAGNGRDMCPLVGVWQGRFRVRFDTTLGEEVVEAHDGRPVAGVDGGEIRLAGAGEGGGAAVMTLDRFRQLVADELVSSSSSP